jgi:hypothetical protein
MDQQGDKPMHITVPTLQAMVAATLAEHVLTEPLQLMRVLSKIPQEHRQVFVAELRQYYETVSSATNTPMAPLHIPAWLT